MNCNPTAYILLLELSFHDRFLHWIEFGMYNVFTYINFFRLMALVFALLFVSGLVFTFFNWPSPMVESHDEKTRGGEEHYKVISR